MSNSAGTTTLSFCEMYPISSTQSRDGLDASAAD